MPSTSAKLGLMSVAIATVGLVGLTLLWGPVIGPAASPSSEAQSAFVGTWFSTSDPDGGTQTMTIRALRDGAVEIVVSDDIASVCSRTPSTMTGTGRLEGNTQLVIPAPVYTCDDGSEAVALSGPPLQDQLRNLTFVRDAQAGSLADDFGGVWLREGAVAPQASGSLAPQASGTLAPQTSDTMWPQSSLEEVRQAQALADAGDPAYTWQVDPQLSSDLWLDHLNQPGAEIAERFLREEMGWDKFLFNLYAGDLDHGAADRIAGVGYVRCGPGETNPLYPGAPVDLMMAPIAEPCAPSIDELRYESVILDLTQPGQGGPTGVWVVSGWRPTAPFAQADPDVAKAEAQARLEDYLQARIEGKGAEGGVDVRGVRVDIPLLYATTSGATYERYEIERTSGPTWPFGSMVFNVRLFADGGETVVEQQIQWNGSGLWHDVTTTTTTENGQPVAVPLLHGFLDGEVTLYAASPWKMRGEAELILQRSDLFDDESLTLSDDPLPVTSGCKPGPTPADAAALAQSLQSDPDLEVTAPAGVSVGGADGLVMDITVAPEASVCDSGSSLVLTDGGRGRTALDLGSRMRLYLIDVPEGLATRILAIAVVAPEARFESVIEAAIPVVDSIEFHAP